MNYHEIHMIVKIEREREGGGEERERERGGEREGVGGREWE